MSSHTRNELSRSRLSKVRSLQTDRHTDIYDRTHYHTAPHSWDSFIGLMYSKINVWFLPVSSSCPWTTPCRCLSDWWRAVHMAAVARHCTLVWGRSSVVRSCDAVSHSSSDDSTSSGRRWSWKCSPELPPPQQHTLAFTVSQHGHQ